MLIRKDELKMFFTYGYLFYGPVNLVYLAVILFYGIKKAKPYPYYFFAFIMEIYINNAINLVFFPIVTMEKELWGRVGRYMDFSLDFVHMGGVRQIAGNILLTLPIGILLPLLFDVSRRFHWIFTITLSCMIEFAQLAIIYFYHSVSLFFDIKDIVLNLAGGIAGLLIYGIFMAFINKFKRIHPETKSAFFKYIYSKT